MPFCVNGLITLKKDRPAVKSKAVFGFYNYSLRCKALFSNKSNRHGKQRNCCKSRYIATARGW